MTQETEEVMAEEETINSSTMISDIDELASLMIEWHQHQVATINHLMQIPEGIDVAVEGEEPFTLDGDKHTAFKLGLSAALTYLGKLPFSTEENEPTQH